jgi:hypothetical protein
MEDNFHIAARFVDESGRTSVGPGLFYRLCYGRDLELVCLDTSQDSDDHDVHRFFQAPNHREWLRDTFAAGLARWVVPFSHHPAYCAGPTHADDEEMVQQLVPLFREAGVRLVLAGHEHNFQLTETGGCTYVVSGAGGKVREDVPQGFSEAGTTAWAAQAHLLLVEVDGAEARLTPVSGLLADGGLHLMTALTPANEVVTPPFVVSMSRCVPSCVVAETISMTQFTWLSPRPPPDRALVWCAVETSDWRKCRPGNTGTPSSTTRPRSYIRPCRTTDRASRRLASVTWFSIPCWSSAPNGEGHHCWSTALIRTTRVRGSRRTG